MGTGYLLFSLSKYGRKVVYSVVAEVKNFWTFIVTVR